MSYSILILKPPNQLEVRLPDRVSSHEEFVDSIHRIRATLIGVSQTRVDVGLVGRLYYFLGFMVGDGIKHCGSHRRLTMDFCLQLSRKYPENAELGDYVARCLQALGLRCVRGHEGHPRNKVPNGYYSWHANYSPVLGWLFTSCLGLEWDEKTTKNSVRMNWVIGAPAIFRIWLLRGLADSDGDVHFQHRRVDIATSPNTKLIKELFESLGIRGRLEAHNAGHGYVTVSCSDAAKIKIFNPQLVTHRRTMREKLANAKVFKTRWPDWLRTKVTTLIRKVLSDREIANTVVDKDGVYLRMRTINKKRIALTSIIE